jgi:hypothetical protein
MAAIAAIAITGWARLAREVPGSDWLHMPALSIVYSEIYVLAGLAALAAAAYPVLAGYLGARKDCGKPSDRREAQGSGFRSLD